MALGGVFMTDTDGNIGKETSSLSEKVCGLLFDISRQPDFWIKGPGAASASALKDSVVELNSLDDAVAVGITPYTGELDENKAGKDLLAGIPYYHIKHFFDLNGGTGRLFVAFADCSRTWNALIDMQKAASGLINQFGVWTEQNLWKDTGGDMYGVSIVGDLQTVGETLANAYNAPASILLCANSAKVATGTGETEKIQWSKIPSCVIDARYVSVLLGQGAEPEVSAMQVSLTPKTPVGTIGAALGCLAKAGVAECIGWVQRFDLARFFADIEFGFGDASVVNGRLANPMNYPSLSAQQLDRLEELGYIFLVRYAGMEGHVYFSGDTTCSAGDYRTISRNRVINKSRRLVRMALLPYVNSPIKVNPATGQLSSAQITIFTNLITDILQAMQNSEEISGIGSVKIPAGQNILKNDRLAISYSAIPIGTSKEIRVDEGLVLKK
jgi:hypothetical protein